MKALRYTGKAIEWAGDYPRPTPAPGEALLRVRMAGVCNTDLEILRGYADFVGVPGHEFVATVEACDDNGDLVISDPALLTVTASTATPAAGLVGLGLLAAGLALAGVLNSRRRN